MGRRHPSPISSCNCWRDFSRTRPSRCACHGQAGPHRRSQRCRSKWRMSYARSRCTILTWMRRTISCAHSASGTTSERQTTTGSTELFEASPGCAARVSSLGREALTLAFVGESGREDTLVSVGVWTLGAYVRAHRSSACVVLMFFVLLTSETGSLLALPL